MGHAASSQGGFGLCPASGGVCGLDPLECMPQCMPECMPVRATASGAVVATGMEEEDAGGPANSTDGTESAAKDSKKVTVMRMTPEVLAAIFDELSMCRVDAIPPHSDAGPEPPAPPPREPGPGERRRRSKGLPLGRNQHASVVLHVYDVSWLATKTGVPAFHTGVEVLGTEFSFGDMGINCNRPGEYDYSRYRKAVPLGRTDLRDQEVLKVLRELQMEWPGEAYRLNGHNCQTFAEVFCQRLGLSNTIPEEYLLFSRPWVFSLGWHAARLGRGGPQVKRPRSTKLSL